MRKFLLSALCAAAALTMAAEEQTVYFVSPTFDAAAAGIAGGIALVNADGSQEGSKDDVAMSLVGQSFDYTAGGVTELTLSFVKGTAKNNSFANGTHSRWYKGEPAVFTPGEGVTITEVKVVKAEEADVADFNSFAATVGGEAAGTVSKDDESTVLTWKGEAAAPLTLTPDGQIRFAYMAVVINASASGLGLSTADSAPAVYYNLQGMRVVNPEQGQVYIVRQGSKAVKQLIR